MKVRNPKTHEKPPACRHPASLLDPDNRRTGRILIVDTDPAIRGLISSSLRHMGHRVSEAESPQGALELVAGGATFDLLVTDIHIRSTGGIAMARNLLDKGATLSVLFMTESVALARALTRSIGTGMFISKPFTAEDFKHHIDECLRRSRKEKGRSPSRNTWARQRLRSIGGRSNRGFWRSSERAVQTFDQPNGETTPIN